MLTKQSGCAVALALLLNTSLTLGADGPNVPTGSSVKDTQDAGAGQDGNGGSVETFVCGSPIGADLICGALESDSSNPPTTPIANYTPVGTIDAFSIATLSCNVGNVNINWSSGTVNHPVIAGSMYRLKTVNGAGRMEQIGIGWVKHGFTALTGSLCCTCNGQGGSVLGVGCSDPYTAGRNGTQITTVGGLGPRFEINAHTGGIVWPYTFRNTSVGIGNTNISRRVQVKFADLDPALNSGARYWVEGQYVAADDAAAGNQNNNVSHTECTIAAVGNPPTNFNASAPTGQTVRESAVIQEWKTQDAAVQLTNVDVPESSGTPTARVIVAARATSLGGGIYHYEYAIFNQNSDRCVDSFRVPVSPYVLVTNVGFHDIDYQFGDGLNSNTTTPTTFDGTDWPSAVSGGQVSWTMTPVAPLLNSNALRWGTMYNYRFDADIAPDVALGTATIHQFKAGGDVNFNTTVPASVTCLRGDINGDTLIDGTDVTRFTQILVNGNSTATPRERCAGDLEAVADFGIDADDIDNFANCLLAGGGC